MSKQTAVEWLVDELEKHHVFHDIKNTNAYQIAKAMEREQIIYAYDTNRDINTIQTAEHYYNETYKGGEQ